MFVESTVLQDILKAYGVDAANIQSEVVIDIDQIQSGEHVVKHYEKVEADGDIYIVRLLRLPMCSEEELERQSAFAEIFRQAGLPTPEHYSVIKGNQRFKEQYLFHIRLHEEAYLVSLEEYGGETVPVKMDKLAGCLGGLLGHMHQISEMKKMSFGPGFFYREFQRGNTEYLPLWGQSGTDFLPQGILQRICRRYDEALIEMRKWMNRLPGYAVQGDLYYMNLTRRHGQTMVIDYDRLGDEILVTDMIITWCRYWYDPHIWCNAGGDHEKRIKSHKMQWDIFFRAYSSRRVLTTSERRAIPCIFGVLSAVYASRLLSGIARVGYKEAAAEGLQDVYTALYDPELLIGLDVDQGTDEELSENL